MKERSGNFDTSIVTPRHHGDSRTTTSNQSTTIRTPFLTPNQAFDAGPSPPNALHDAIRMPRWERVAE